MKNLQIQGVSELSAKDLKTIEGGVMVAVLLCLFALGMAVGLGIGNRVRRR